MRSYAAHSLNIPYLPKKSKSGRQALSRSNSVQKDIQNSRSVIQFKLILQADKLGLLDREMLRRPD
jgi:hypothetical protein